MLNPTDMAVNHAYAREIFQNWQKLGAANLQLHELDAKYGLEHDLIDPDQPTQKIDIVYPFIMDALI